MKIYACWLFFSSSCKRREGKWVSNIVHIPRTTMEMELLQCFIVASAVQLLLSNQQSFLMKNLKMNN